MSAPQPTPAKGAPSQAASRKLFEPAAPLPPPPIIQTDGLDPENDADPQELEAIARVCSAAGVTRWVMLDNHTFADDNQPPTGASMYLPANAPLSAAAFQDGWGSGAVLVDITGFDPKSALGADPATTKYPSLAAYIEVLHTLPDYEERILAAAPERGASPPQLYEPRGTPFEPELGSRGSYAVIVSYTHRNTITQARNQTYAIVVQTTTGSAGRDFNSLIEDTAAATPSTVMDFFGAACDAKPYTDMLHLETLNRTMLAARVATALGLVVDTVEVAEMREACLAAGISVPRRAVHTSSTLWNTIQAVPPPSSSSSGGTATASVSSPPPGYVYYSNAVCTNTRAGGAMVLGSNARVGPRLLLGAPQSDTSSSIKFKSIPGVSFATGRFANVATMNAYPAGCGRIRREAEAIATHEHSARARGATSKPAQDFFAGRLVWKRDPLRLLPQYREINDRNLPDIDVYRPLKYIRDAPNGRNPEWGMVPFEVHCGVIAATPSYRFPEHARTHHA
jgi:hypothetical protein